ncbi:MAG: 50S ribosomal protein L30 [Thermoanaerobaculales bacterium]
MTTRKKAARAQLKITQVRSIIGNQERVKRVVTDGLGLGRIGRSVLLPDNPYTRGMIAKAAHIVAFEELAVEAHPVKAGTMTSEAIEAAVATPEVKVRAPRKRTAAKSEA